MSRRVIHHLTVLGLCCSVVLAASTVAHAGAPRTPTAQSHANADAVVAFDRSKTSPSRSFSIAYLTECVDNPYCVARLEGIRDAAKKYGATVKVFDSKWSLVAQERTAEIAVTEGVWSAGTRAVLQALEPRVRNDRKTRHGYGANARGHRLYARSSGDLHATGGSPLSGAS
jgi:hypothetical protein